MKSFKLMATLMNKYNQDRQAEVKVYVPMEHEKNEKELKILVDLHWFKDFPIGSPIYLHILKEQIIKVSKRTVRSEKEIENYPETQRLHKEILEILEDIKKEET